MVLNDRYLCQPEYDIGHEHIYVVYTCTQFVLYTVAPSYKTHAVEWFYMVGQLANNYYDQFRSVNSDP